MVCAVALLRQHPDVWPRVLGGLLTPLRVLSPRGYESCHGLSVEGSYHLPEFYCQSWEFTKILFCCKNHIFLEHTLCPDVL